MSNDKSLERYLAEHGILEGWADLTHGRQRYFVGGSGPPLIILHGVSFWMSGDKMLMLFPELAKHYRVYAPDLLGWGASDKPAWEYSSPWHMVIAIRELMDWLKIGSAHLVGMCFGGRLGLMYTALSPSRVKALVVASMATKRLVDEIDPEAFRLPKTNEEIEQLIVTRLGSVRPHVDVEAFVRWTSEMIRSPGSEDGFRNYLRHRAADHGRAQWAINKLPFPTMHVPILFNWPRHDDSAPAEQAEKYHARIPTSSLRMHDGGHFYPYERAEEFGEAVVEYFAHVAANPLPPPAPRPALPDDGRVR